MKTFLIIAERPKHVDQVGATTAWQEFLTAAKQIAPKAKGGDELPEGVWLIALDNAMRTMEQLLPLAKEGHIALRGLLLDEPPAWIKYP